MSGVRDMIRTFFGDDIDDEPNPPTREPPLAPATPILPTWKTVRVFISSTFRDMHAERDHLVKITFPRLRQWCEEHRLYLVDIDLRWGVTREEAENGKAIEICLQEIDGSRPFFVCLLGGRYGWVPQDLPPEEHYGFRRLAHRSITHLEIIHATDESLRLDAHQRRPACRHAFFYLRSDDCVPAGEPTFFEKDPDLQRRVAELKEQVCERFEGDGRVFRYCGRWDSDARNPEDPSLEGRLTDLGALGDRVGADLQQAIAAQFADHIAALGSTDELLEERSYHETFIENRTRVYVSRPDLEALLSGYADGAQDRALVVSGPPGSGKSALVAHWVRQRIDRGDANELVLARFIGASPASTSLHRLLANLAAELVNHFALTEQVGEGDRTETVAMAVPRDAVRLREKWPRILAAAGARGRVTVVLDAVNQLDRSASPDQLDWLTLKLPRNVRLIVSVLEHPGDSVEGGGWLAALRAHPLPALEVPPLSEDDCRRIIRELPSVFCKTLDPEQVALLLANAATRNPLFLTVALEELRVFGSFDRLAEAIRGLPRLEDAAIGGDVERAIEAIFGQVLARLDRETDRHVPGLPAAIFRSLASARDGLSEEEIVQLATRVLPDSAGAEVAGLAQVVLRQVRTYLMRKGARRSALVDFFHRTFWKAARARYLGSPLDRLAEHRRLAAFFADQAHTPGGQPNVRKAAELPWQLLSAAREAGKVIPAATLELEWAPLAGPLCDLEFIEMKARAGLWVDLLADYEQTLAGWPGHVPYSPFPSGDTHLDARPDPLLAEMNRTELAAAEARDTGASSTVDRIDAFSAFAKSHADVLATAPEDVIPVARNHARSGVVAEDADRLVEKLSRPWIARDPRPASAPGRPICVRTIEAEGDAFALSADGRTLVSSGADGSIVVRDVATGAVRQRLPGHESPIFQVSMSSDGRVAMTASRKQSLLGRLSALTGSAPQTRRGAGDDQSIRVWDLAEGSCIGTLPAAMSFAVNSTGSLVAAVTLEGALEIWDLADGSQRRVPSDAGKMTRVALSPDGHVAVACSTDNVVRAWDVDSGKVLGTFEGHRSGVAAMAVSHDRRWAASAGGYPMLGDNAIRVWDLVEGGVHRTLEGHTGRVTGLALVGYGRIAVSCAEDATLRVWDVEAGTCVRKIVGPSTFGGVAITADGRTALTVDGDAQFRVWNIASGEPVATQGHTVDEPAELTQPTGEDAKSPELLSQIRTRSIDAIAISGAGVTVISAGRDLVLRLWRAADGAPQGALHGHMMWIREMALSHDGLAITAASDDTLRVWDLERRRCLRVLTGHDGATSHAGAVALAPDGRTLVSASGIGAQTIRIWDLPSGETLRVLRGHTHWVTSVAVTPDGKAIVSGGTDQQLRIWDVASGTCCKAIDSRGHNVMRIAMSPDGRGFAVATIDGVVRWWALPELSCARELVGHAGIVTGVGVSADGGTIVSSGTDGTVRLWDVQSGQSVAVYHARSSVTSVSAIRPDGLLACGSEDGQVHVLHIRGRSFATSVATMGRRFAYDLTKVPASEARSSAPVVAAGQMIPGALQAEPSFVCPACAGSFAALGPSRRCPGCAVELRLSAFSAESVQPERISWREDAALAGRLHEDHPDDVQVLVHDGHPLRTRRAPEGVWVRITGKRGAAYVGTVLNQPHRLRQVKQGDEILFVAREGDKYAIQVREPYLLERESWKLVPCSKCGLSETLDPPSVLIETETAKKGKKNLIPCALCEGVQALILDPPTSSTGADAKKPWWKLWG